VVAEEKNLKVHAADGREGHRNVSFNANEDSAHLQGVLIRDPCITGGQKNHHGGTRKIAERGSSRGWSEENYDRKVLLKKGVLISIITKANFFQRFPGGE